MQIEHSAADTLLPGNVNMKITKIKRDKQPETYIVRLSDFSGSREHEFVFECKTAHDLRSVLGKINLLVDEILTERKEVM